MTPWLEQMLESSTLLGALLRIFHPEQFTSCMMALQVMADFPEVVKEEEQVLNILRLWSSPYSSYSVVSNRRSVIHRDNSSRPECFDTLLTLGDYADGIMVFPNLGVHLRYNPGTLIALSGKLIQHGVEEVDGNRVCLAFYMKDNVHERLKIPPPGWMTMDIH